MKYGPKIYGFKAFTLFKFTHPKQSVCHSFNGYIGEFNNIPFSKN